jgi:hypothetical protein
MNPIEMATPLTEKSLSALKITRTMKSMISQLQSPFLDASSFSVSRPAALAELERILFLLLQAAIVLVHPRWGGNQNGEIESNRQSTIPCRSGIHREAVTFCRMLIRQAIERAAITATGSGTNV